MHNIHPVQCNKYSGMMVYSKCVKCCPYVGSGGDHAATAPGLTPPHLYVAGEGSVGNVDNGHDLSGHQWSPGDIFCMNMALLVPAHDTGVELQTKVREDFTITWKAPTFKTLVRHYAKQYG